MSATTWTPTALASEARSWAGEGWRAVDLTTPPLAADRPLWTHPSDYAPTQALAAAAREAGIDAIRYESVRNPGGRCLALLSPAVFLAVPEPYRNNQQSWTLLIHPPHRVVWQRELFDESWMFEFPA